jgi:hypothetical protein
MNGRSVNERSVSQRFTSTSTVGANLLTAAHTVRGTIVLDMCWIQVFYPRVELSCLSKPFVWTVDCLSNFS